MRRPLAPITFVLFALLVLLAPGIRASAAGLSQLSPRIVYTHRYNVFLMNLQGRAPSTVTTRGSEPTGRGGIIYPWYQWSPDGRYLLLLRMNTNAIKGELLLLDHGGKVLRDLASVPGPTDFWPSWALDGDQIVYISRQSIDRKYGGFDNSVSFMGVTGRGHLLFTYHPAVVLANNAGQPVLSP